MDGFLSIVVLVFDFYFFHALCPLGPFFLPFFFFFYSVSHSVFLSYVIGFVNYSMQEPMDL